MAKLGSLSPKYADHMQTQPAHVIPDLLFRILISESRF